MTGRVNKYFFLYLFLSEQTKNIIIFFGTNTKNIIYSQSYIKNIETLPPIIGVLFNAIIYVYIINCSNYEVLFCANTIYNKKRGKDETSLVTSLHDVN